jgi:TPR repeat protein
MELDRVVPEDFPLAAKFFTLAANQNITPAGYKLGVMHLMGGGIPKNLAEAQRWFKFAAERGHADAQIDLGIMYLRKNRTTAHMWVNISASLGGKHGPKALRLSRVLWPLRTSLPYRHSPVNVSVRNTKGVDCNENSTHHIYTCIFRDVPIPVFKMIRWG